MSVDGRYQAVTETGCWLWMGAVGGRYGQIRKGGRIVYAHRYSYETSKGPIPDGMQICHKCDTPTCINPDHLFLGTGADNIRDMHRKMRSPVTRLTPAQVAEAKTLRESGWSYPKLAAHFGIAISSMEQRIKGRKSRGTTARLTGVDSRAGSREMKAVAGP